MFPELAQLPPENGRAAALALADVAAPCAPCVEPLTMLSDCALAAPPGCENLPRLVLRVARAAKTETNPKKLSALVAYGDIWVAGVAPADVGASIPVELWVDLSSPVLDESLTLYGEMRKIGDPRPYTIHLFSAPYRKSAEKLSRLGFVAQREGELWALFACVGEARGAGGAAARWAATGALDEEAELALEGLSSCSDLELGRWSEVAETPEIAAIAAEEQALAEALGVRSAPTWFINGYRMRGLQSLTALTMVLSRERADLEESL